MFEANYSSSRRTPYAWCNNQNNKQNIKIDISNKTDTCCFYFTLPITFPYFIAKEVCKYTCRKKKRHY